MGFRNKSRGGRDDAYLYKNYLSHYFDNKRLQEISPFDLERLKSDLSKKGISPASIKLCIVLFRQMINKAIAWRMYEGKNPVKEVKIPTVQMSGSGLRFIPYGTLSPHGWQSRGHLFIQFLN